MISKEFVENYIEKRRKIKEEYDKKLNELDIGYKLSIADKLSLKIGDVVDANIKNINGDIIHQLVKIITGITINTDGTITISAATRNKTSDRWSKRSHYWKTINPCNENEIKVLRHEEYSKDV